MRGLLRALINWCWCCNNYYTERMTGKKHTRWQRRQCTCNICWDNGGALYTPHVGPYLQFSGFAIGLRKDGTWFWEDTTGG